MTQRELEWSAAWIALNSNRGTSTEGKLIALVCDLHYFQLGPDRATRAKPLTLGKLVYKARGLATTIEPRKSQA